MNDKDGLSVPQSFSVIYMYIYIIYNFISYKIINYIYVYIIYNFISYEIINYIIIFKNQIKFIIL